MDEKIRFSGWAAWLDGDSIWWCQDEHSGSAPMQPRTGFEEDMLDEIRRLRAELANKDQILGDTLAVLCGDGGHYRAEHGDIKAKEHGLKRYHDLLVSEDGLRAELAVERKRQSAMRTLIASQEGTLSHYRSKQAEADEAVRTLDSERAANAALTAELAACREDAERYRWIREHWDDVNHPVDFIICNSFVTTLDADVDAARKGEGG